MGFTTKLLTIIGYLPLKITDVYFETLICNIHTFLMCAFISIPFFISIYDSIKSESPLKYSYLAFYTILPIQYILGARYIRTKHFDTIISTSKSSQISIPKLKICLFVILTIMLTTSVFTTILLITKSIPSSYKTLPDQNLNKYGTNDGILAIVIMTWIISSIPFAINVSIFWIVLHKHSIDLTRINDELVQACWNMAGIDDVGTQIIQLKYIIKTSVEHIQGFYTSMAILGGIGIGPIIDSHQIDAYLTFYIIVYAICHIMFLYFMYVLSNKQSSVMEVLQTPNYMFRYINNVRDTKNFDIEKGNTLKLQMYAPDMVSASRKQIPTILHIQNRLWAMQKWQTISNELKEDWFQFGMAGFKFDNKEIIQKSITITSGIIFLSAWINSFQWI